MIASETEELLLKEILNAIPSGVGVYDVTGDVVKKIYLNDGYYAMIGGDREKRHQYDGTATMNAIFKEDTKGLVKELMASIRENKLFSYTFRVIDGRGSNKWIAIAASHAPLNAETERFFASYYDVDELVREHEKLSDEEKMLNDSLRYSDIIHFTYFPQKHSYEINVLPEKFKWLPSKMENYPEAYIELAGLSNDDAAKYREMVHQIDEGAQEAQCVIQTHVNGKSSWSRIRMWNYLNEDGRSERAVGNAFDINEYKEAERRFNEEKLRMDSLQRGVLSVSCFNVTQDRNIELNNDRNLSYKKPANAAVYYEALEVDPQIADQRDETLNVLLAAAEQIPDREQRRKFLDTCSHFSMLRNYEAGNKELMLTYRRWTGKGLIWVSTRIVLVEDPDTEDLLAFYYTSDINDRVIYRKLSSKVLNRSFISVSYYDCNSGRLFIQDDADESGIKYVPMSYELVVESAVSKYMSPEKADTMKENFSMEKIMKSLSENDDYTVFYTSSERAEEIPGKPYRRIKFDIFYLDDDRDVIVIVQSDVTEVFEQEKETREKMSRALQTAERANMAKTEFISRISHDIRTPISIISSMTEFAYRDLDDRDKLVDDLSNIKTANVFLLSLINDVLDISKIDSGNIALDPQPYTFEEHSKNIISVMKTMCEEKGLHYSFVRNHKTGVIVADKVRINQIALNLISNAVKYTPAGGSVTYVSDSIDLPDNKIKFGFEIIDTGIGMSEEFQKIMFEPFSQEYDNEMRPKGITGTGLGLSIVKKMVDLMGGTIEVSSFPGKGTTVCCSIIFPDALRDPRYAYFREENKVEHPNRMPLSGKVIIAEDNPINTVIARRIVSSFGIESVCVDNGRKAVDVFASSEPEEYAAILMDIQMPVMNGYEAAENIRKLERSDAASIPIIAMTADAFNDAAKRSLKCGMNEYIVKPLDQDLIYDTLKKYLE